MLPGWENRCAMSCVSGVYFLSKFPVDGLIVQLRPRFVVYCVELLARRRWEDVSSISMMTRVGHLL